MHKHRMILSLANLANLIRVINVTGILHIISQQTQPVAKQPSHHYKGYTTDKPPD